jgi:hypothetical protein
VPRPDQTGTRFQTAHYFDESLQFAHTLACGEL